METKKNIHKKKRLNSSGIPSSGMVARDESSLLQSKKRKRAKIIAIAVIIVLILGVAGGVLSFFFLNTGVPAVPNNLRIEDFDQEKDFSLLLRWDDIFNATFYTLEYKYELYPDTIASVNIQNSDYYYIERKRGEFSYRLCANNDDKKGEFTSWQTIEILPLKLNLPEITLIQDGTDVIVSWTDVKYKYYNDEGSVYYEFLEGGYFEDDIFENEDDKYWSNSSLKTNKNEYVFENITSLCDIFVVKIRAINYTVMYMGGLTNEVVFNEPVSLYDIYELTDIWTEKEIILTK